MLRIFRTNQLLAGVMLLPYLIVLKAYIFISPVTYQATNAGILYNTLLEYIDINSWQGHSLTILLLLVQGFMLNYILINNRLLRDVNLFPGVFYVLIMALLPEYFYLSPFLVGNTFLILAMLFALSLKGKKEESPKILNIGIVSGLAGLVHPAFFVFLPAWIIPINTIRMYNTREWLISLIGMALPPFYLWLYFLWNDTLELFSSTIFSGMAVVNTSFIPSFPSYLVLGTIILLTLIVSFSFRANLSKNIMEVQHRYQVLYWLMFFSLIGILFADSTQMDRFLIAAPVLGLLIAFNFSRMRSSVAETLHLIILLFILFLQYKGLLGL